jgi:putative membrane protein
MDVIPSVARHWFPRFHVGRRLISFMVVVMIYATMVAALLWWLRIPTRTMAVEWTLLDAIVLGTLLVFRNKEAYDRWWEGRKLWGQLINETRELLLKVRAFVLISPDELSIFGRRVALFAQVLRLHLRDASHNQISKVLPDCRGHGPIQVASLLNDQVAAWHRDGKVPNPTILMFEPHLRALMDICGACERIKTSPVPSSYRSLLRQGLTFYLVMAPWMAAIELSFWGLPAFAVTAYFVLGIELTAEEVEQPFGTEPDDLAMDSYCQTIEKAVAEILAMPPVHV